MSFVWSYSQSADISSVHHHVTAAGRQLSTQACASCCCHAPTHCIWTSLYRNAGALHGSSPPGNSVGWLLGSSPPNGVMGTSPTSTSSSFGAHRDAATSGTAFPFFCHSVCQQCMPCLLLHTETSHRCRLHIDTAFHFGASFSNACSVC